MPSFRKHNGIAIRAGKSFHMSCTRRITAVVSNTGDETVLMKDASENRRDRQQQQWDTRFAECRDGHVWMGKKGKIGSWLWFENISPKSSKLVSQKRCTPRTVLDRSYRCYNLRGPYESSADGLRPVVWFRDEQSELVPWVKTSRLRTGYTSTPFPL